VVKVKIFDGTDHVSGRVRSWGSIGDKDVLSSRRSISWTTIIWDLR
jgi:hypothetical protein